MNTKAEQKNPSSESFAKPRATWIHRGLLLSFLITGLSGCLYEYKLTDLEEGDGGTETETHFNNDTETETDFNDDTECHDGEKAAAAGGLTWVTICGGEFDMGSADGDDDEIPVHSVSVPTFEMLLTEVTVAQYQTCVQAASCTAPPSGGAGVNWGLADRENYPINNVTWYQAEQFCTWAGGRLPSEAEWEYAASNGSAEDKYPWGDQRPTCEYAIMDEGINGCGTDRSWPVCSRTAGNTTHGLCDMAGNVWEWVQDWHHSTYTGAPVDGTAWEDPVGTERVYKGGAYYNLAGGPRASNRMFKVPSFYEDWLGFRCVK